MTSWWAAKLVPSYAASELDPSLMIPPKRKRICQKEERSRESENLLGFVCTVEPEHDCLVLGRRGRNVDV
jgi:hypothetical protein